MKAPGLPEGVLGGGRSEVGAYLGCLRGSGGGKRRPGDSRELKGAEGQAGFSTRN